MEKGIGNSGLNARGRNLIKGHSKIGFVAKMGDKGAALAATQQNGINISADTNIFV